MPARRYKDISVAAKLLVLATLLLQQSAVFGGEEEKEACRADQLQFYGNVSIEEREGISKLKEGYISIEVNEEAGVRGEEEGSGVTTQYRHNIPLESIRDKEEIAYSICVDRKDVKGSSMSLTGKVVDTSSEQKVDYLGETVVKQVSDTNEADIQLAKVEQTAGWQASELSIADCTFGEIADDVRGVAVKVKVTVEGEGAKQEEGAKERLPAPSYLAVTLKETEDETGEADVISVFAGDVSDVYKPGQPLYAFLCAKLPSEYPTYRYSLQANLHVGWDGALGAEDEQRAPRDGDFATAEEVPIAFDQRQSEYSAEVSVAPFKSR